MVYLKQLIYIYHMPFKLHNCLLIIYIARLSSIVAQVIYKDIARTSMVESMVFMGMCIKYIAKNIL